MQIEFLTATGSDRLILIFAGWASLPELYADIYMPGWDVAVVYGIDPAQPDWSQISGYPTIYLFAWSLGVYSAAAHLPSEVNICAAFAINGTLYPVNDEKGIPANIFTGTASTLNERNLRKFRARMFDSMADFKSLEERLCRPQDIIELQQQLNYVLQHQAAPAGRIKWTRCFIGKTDRIFPTENQYRAWQESGIEAELLEAPHYIDLRHIISQTIINPERVGKRFTRSLPTYSAHAHAQRVIAEHLAAHYMTAVPDTLQRVIEIGPGSGLFTGLWSTGRHCREALFVDVSEMPEYGVADKEIYMQHDAEKVISDLAANNSGSFDAIFSTSAIQWLSNLQHFFRCCAAVLKQDGELVMSTFAPGNLHELSALRPDHLRYHTAAEIQEMLQGYFSEVQVAEDVVELDFTSPLEALRHLQLTGVTTSGHKADIRKLRAFAEAYPVNERRRYSLTFRPIYLRARK